MIEHKKKAKQKEDVENIYRSDWSSEMFVDYIKHRMKLTGFLVDDNNRNVVNALCHYFNGKKILNELGEDTGRRIGRKVFEEFTLNTLGQKMDLTKGIFLFGSVGVGKTRVMELFQSNKLQCYQVVSCRKIVSEFIKNGDEVILPLSTQSYHFAKSIDNFWQESMGMCFDDLGTESDSAQNYGNRRNVLEQIILDRYDNHLPFHQTHITSNLTPAMIKDRYGDRVNSRMREMFNLIEISGPDRRR